MSKIFNVVLSGGSGTRLWPLSRKNNPKQFLKIFNNLSLFQHTIDRNKELVNDFLLLTNKDQIKEANRQIKETSQNFKQVIIEPIGRNTAPAIALASLAVNPEDILFVTPCDHMITNNETYRACFGRAVELAKEDYLVTFGIKPEAPETGFGYIEHNDEDVVSFREKPDQKTATDFIKAGNFLWNSGMFCFKAGVFLEELRKYRKDIFETSVKAINSIENQIIDIDAMIAIPDESVDYAVFEKSDKIKTVPSNFEWTDLGTFDALINFNQKNQNSIDCISEVGGISTEGTFYLGNKKVYSLGVSDIIVVETDDCIVLLSKEKSQEIKKLHKLVENNDESLL
ncbi:mannose-1-phosphate guanyltransferase [Aquimarina aggregata]|uniref:Mannose-1-phosphate guanyltransferase n=1 Tax=Aquimarina aggregata TaxID=1642818 RepID=A0A163BJ93_9FLAO|nr:mannose-1-phosphate guanylyltransferase [Aquimarina aggregata]KZS41455.1 mannose-1-phosphate guanyltransferase [Aquimarina aggregata]